MFAFFRIERPTKATFRPQSTPTSAACCIRWTFEAKEDDEDPALAAREDLAERLADDALRLGDARPARRSSSRRAGGRRPGCRSPRGGRRRCAGRRPACGRACSRPCGRSGRPASRARPRPRRGSNAPSARTRAGTGRAGRARLPARAPAARRRGASPCSSSFDLTSASVSRVAMTSGTRTSRIRYGSAPT